MRGADVCLVHMQGEPRTMQDDPRYDDVVGEVRAFLEERLDVASAPASPRSASGSIPGSASARRSSTTSSCSGGSDEIVAIGRPVVFGASRKRFLGGLTGRPERGAGGRGPWRSTSSLLSAGATCSASTTSPRPGTPSRWRVLPWPR